MSPRDFDQDGSLDMFEDPDHYYPPSPQPKIERHMLLSGRELALRLVGYNPLWGHHLWNAGRVVSNYLESHASLIESKAVLELGAGAGLPSLVCAILGARTVVVTDYPDSDLIQNLEYNIEHCQAECAFGDHIEIKPKVFAEGYLWGADPRPLLAHVAPAGSTSLVPAGEPSGFDILILADLLFNHSEHAKLVYSIQQTLANSPASQALVFFTPYRPWLLEKDIAFFDLAREAGFTVEKVLEEKMENVMFEEDRGDEDLRRTVFGYIMRRQEERRYP